MTSSDSQHLAHPAARRRSAPGAAPGTLIVDPHAPKPRIDVVSYDGDDVRVLTDVDVAGAVAAAGAQAVTWIDVRGLGDTEVLEGLGRHFGLHMLALEDVINVHQRPKAESYEDCLFVCARMPRADDGHRFATEQLSLFLTKGVLITFQEREGDCFAPVRRRIMESRGRIRRSGADYLLYALLDAVTDAFFPVLEQHGERLDALEAEVIGRSDPAHNTAIHRLKRDLLTVRRCIWPQRDMLNALVRDDHALIADETRTFLRDCFDHTIQLMDLVETYREIASDLVDIHLSRISTRLNEVMMALTIIATIFMPLTLITGVYGMNFTNMPELRWPWGYPFALGLMAAVAAAMLLWFRRRGWIGRPRKRRSRLTAR
jgi:magnesium transporter